MDYQQDGKIQELKRQYLEREYVSQMKECRKVFLASYEEAKSNMLLEEALYNSLESFYDDAELIWNEQEISVEQKRELMYHIYNQYFKQLSVLKYKVRRKMHADKYIRRMHKVIKNGRLMTNSARFWLKFSRVCIPPLIVGFIGEFAFINCLDSGNLLLIILSFLVFAGGFGVYSYFVYQTEGERLYSDLEKWISYKLHPGEEERPQDILQYIKMLIPLAIAVLSAMAKIYIK